MGLGYRCQSIRRVFEFGVDLDSAHGVRAVDAGEEPLAGKLAFAGPGHGQVQEDVVGPFPGRGHAADKHVVEGQDLRNDLQVATLACLEIRHVESHEPFAIDEQGRRRVDIAQVQPP